MEICCDLFGEREMKATDAASSTGKDGDTAVLVGMGGST